MSQSPHAPSPQPNDGPASHRSKYRGKRLGKFLIIGELGRGGMGVVFEARDTVLDRHVAIKLLPRSVAEQSVALERFLREARAAAKLHHPNVVAVYDADQVNGQYYIVLELIRGGSLQDVLKRGPLPWDAATRTMAEACRGLVVAHRAGLVHRDIKPSNLMRSEDGTVKLSDFGLVRGCESELSMTGSGSVLGTPQFMSPEQCRSELADEQSDVYSMGATYFALLTGRVPYPGQAPLLVMNAHLLNPVPDPRDVNPAIPAACARIVKRAMAKEPDDRYPSAQELLNDLNSALESCQHDSFGISSEVRVVPPMLDRTWRFARYARPGIELILLFVVISLIGWMIWGRITTLRPSVQSPSAMAFDFPLPGLTRDESHSDSTHESWTLAYPGIMSLAIPHSGEFLAVLINRPEGRIHVWNRAGVRLLDESVSGRATCLATSADGRLLAAGTVGGHGVVVWNVRDLKHKTNLPSLEDVHAVTLSGDGRWLAFSTSVNQTDGAWVLWDLAAGKQTRRIVISGSGRVGTIGFGVDRDQIVATGSNDGRIRIWNLRDLDQQPQILQTGVAIQSLSMAPDKSMLAVGAGKYFALWDYDQIRRDHAVPSMGPDVACVAFAPTGRQVAWAAGTTVQYLGADSRRTITTLPGLNRAVASLAFTPDASHLLSSTYDGKLVIWQLTE